MKKKTPSIVVDDQTYNWAVVENEWPNASLRVWLDGDKNILWLEIDVSVVGLINPSHIAELIRKTKEKS